MIYENARRKYLKIVTIHQPNYAPYLGFWHKLATATDLISLETCQFSKGSMTNRMLIWHQGKPHYLTIPLQSPTGKAINELEYANLDWTSDHLATLYHAYHKTPHFGRVFPLLERIYAHDAERGLAQFNLRLIEGISSLLRLPCLFCPDRILKIEATGEDRLLQLCQHVRADVYLSGGGGRNYLHPERWEEAGIALYIQGPLPLPEEGVHLSALHSLFHMGPEALYDWLRFPTRPAFQLLTSGLYFPKPNLPPHFPTTRV